MRTIAFGFDVFAILLLRKIAFNSYLLFLRPVLSNLPGKARAELLNGLGSLDILVSTLLFVAYFAISLYISNGRTIGKMIMGLRVHPNKLGTPIELKQSLLRAVGYFIGYIPMCLLLTIPYFRKDGMGLPDFLSSSLVTLEDLSGYEPKPRLEASPIPYGVELITCPLVEEVNSPLPLPKKAA